MPVVSVARPRAILKIYVNIYFAKGCVRAYPLPKAAKRKRTSPKSIVVLIVFDTAKVGKLPSSPLNDEPVSGESVEVLRDPHYQIYSPLFRFLSCRVST